MHPASSHQKNTFSFFFSFHCIYIRRQMLDGSIVAILSQYTQVNRHAVGLQVKNREREDREGEGRGRDWGDVPLNQGRPAHRQPPGSWKTANEEGFALESLREQGAADIVTLEPGLQDLRMHFCVSQPPAGAPVRAAVRNYFTRGLAHALPWMKSQSVRSPGRALQGGAGSTRAPSA